MVTLSLVLAPVMDGQRFDMKLGLLYIAAQSLGAGTAALLQKIFVVSESHLFFGLTNDPMKLQLYYDSNEFFQAIVLESIGCFMLVFMWLSTQNKATRFSEDMAINNLFLAAATLCSMLIGGVNLQNLALSPCNPTIGFFITFMN